MKIIVLFFLLIFSTSAHADAPACTVPNSYPCAAQAVNPQPTDILTGTQAQGPSRLNQTVKYSISQILSGGLDAVLGSAVIGTPTGGNQGAGTVNATGVFVNGVPVGSGTFLPLTGGTLSGPLTGTTITGTTLTGTTGTIGNTTTPGVMTTNGAAGTQRDYRFNTANLQRWSIQGHNDAETGNNKGTGLWIRAFNDDGTLNANTSLLQASRASGPFGKGAPFFDIFGPFQQLTPRATTAGAVSGNLQDYSNGFDVQPTATLLANPIATTLSSRVVNITWANCCNSTGPLFSATREIYVSLKGAAVVAGIDFNPAANPNGWYPITVVNANTFSITVSVAQGAANATVAAGGGSAVTARPSFTTQGNKRVMVSTDGTSGFHDGDTYYYVANPEFYSPTGAGPRFQTGITQAYTPNDLTSDNAWATVLREDNYINRGLDLGYAPILSTPLHNMVGNWMGPLAGPVTIVPGGGTGHNWNTAQSCFSAYGLVGIYDCISNQPDALVGAANDVTGHGGVFADAFGSYDTLPDHPFQTTNGSNIIIVTTQGSGADNANDGDSVYLPIAQTINGVTFGGQNYVISATNHATNKFSITGSGNASSTGTGGVIGWMSFQPFVPYAPYQATGEFKHGIIANQQSRFQDGLFVHSIPGAGVGWDDGTGIAIMTGISSGAGNVGILITPAGTGKVTVTGFPTSCSGLLSGTLFNNSGAPAFCP